MDRYRCGYDRAGNRMFRENVVAMKNLAPPVALDELYAYDGMHRLQTFDRGTLGATQTALVGTPARSEDWSLDPLGNWACGTRRGSPAPGFSCSPLPADGTGPRGW